MVSLNEKFYSINFELPKSNFLTISDYHIYSSRIYDNNGLGFFNISRTGIIERIVYKEIRGGFERWIKSKVSAKVAKDYLSYLDRYIGDRVIRNSSDVAEIMFNIKRGKDKFAKAFRNLINYCVEFGIISEEFANRLRRTVKFDYSIGVDLYVPSDEEVREWIERIDREDAKLATLLIAFSGLRIKEAVRILQNFDEKRLKLEKINGVEIAYYELGWARKTKMANYAFMPGWLGRRFRKMDTTYYRIQAYAVKRGVKLKYLRKWLINKLVEFGVPESVVKFIIGHSQGHNIMGIHYLDLLKQAKRYYGKVLHSLEEALRIREVIRKGDFNG